MNFTTPSRVADVIQRMLDSDNPRAINRTRIHSHFNGNPPWTEDEAQENRIQYNVPWGSGPTIMDNARGMWETAFTSKDKYFTVRLTTGPIEKRLEWSMRLTEFLARIMKREPEYTDCVNTVGASVMLDGIGPVAWENEDRWCPYPIAIEDLKVPSRTLTSFTNLGYFAIMRRWTPFELYEAALGEYAQPGWNKKLVGVVLGKLSEVNSEQTDWAQYQFPERLEEDYKSNAGYWGSDAVPTINCWDFYHRGEKKESKKLYRKIMLDWDQPALGGSVKANSEDKGDFIYTSSDPYCDDLQQVLHCTFANGAHVGPFRYYSVRGLGHRLYRQSITLDRMLNKTVEAWFVEMLQIFKNVPAEDREKLEMIYVANMGVMPQGATYLPQNERYRPDLAHVMTGINQMRQLLSENSASYVQDVESDQESSRETATKTQARMQSANRLIGSFLAKSYVQMQRQYAEICRRFCRKDSEDEDVQEFHEMCREHDIPKEALDVKRWDITPERVLANGDRLLGAILIDRLMAQYPRFGPDAQRQLLRIFTESSSDPDLATMLVPLDEEQQASPTEIEAYQALGPLMLGLPSPINQAGNQIEFVEVLLQALTSMVNRIQESGGMADEKTVIGLFTVGQEAQRRIDLIEQDPEEKGRTKVYNDILLDQMNLIRGMAQRLKEQAKQQGSQISAELQAKLQSNLILAQSTAKQKEATTAQKLRHKEIMFAAEQRRKDAAAQLDMQRQAQTAMIERQKADLLTEGQIQNERKKAVVAAEQQESDKSESE